MKNRAAVLGLLLYASLPVAAQTLTGTATYRERMALPPDAVLEVRIEDVSRADAAAVTVGAARVAPAGQVPIPYSVAVSGPVDARHRYVLRAWIVSGQERLFMTTSAYPVLTGGAPGNPHDLMMERMTTPDRPLAGTYWKLIRLADAPVAVTDHLPEPHLILDAANERVHGFGGCNSYSGSYTTHGAALAIGPVAATMRACLAHPEQETNYLAMLAAVRRYTIHGDELTLEDDAGQPLARLTGVDLR